jgi:hypothetical protein
VATPAASGGVCANPIDHSLRVSGRRENRIDAVRNASLPDDKSDALEKTHALHLERRQTEARGKLAGCVTQQLKRQFQSGDGLASSGDNSQGSWSEMPHWYAPILHAVASRIAIFVVGFLPSENLPRQHIPSRCNRPANGIRGGGGLMREGTCVSIPMEECLVEFARTTSKKTTPL